MVRALEQTKKEKPRRKKIFEGIISITRNGRGFFMSDALEEDILIEPEYLGKAVNGDTVRVLQLPQLRGERVKGKVLEVLARARDTFVGTIQREGKNIFLECDAIRMHTDILLPFEMQKSQCPIGYKAQVQVYDWDNEMPYGKIIKCIGKAGLHETEMQAIVLEQGFEEGFDFVVQDAANKLHKKAQV